MYSPSFQPRTATSENHAMLVSAGTINRNNRLIGRFAMILINRLLKLKIDHFRLLFLLTWSKFPFKRGLAYHERHA